MTPGRFIAVVGPSGVGKDSVMAGLIARQPNLIPVRRVITRPAAAGGEDSIGVTEAVFSAHVAQGDFVLHWCAHGLFYGIPTAITDDLAQGRDVLANLSRGVLANAAARFADMMILSLTARPETLALRLAGRGRETAADIAVRLARTAQLFPPGVPVIKVSNDGALDDAVAAAMAGIYPGQFQVSRQDMNLPSGKM